MSSISTGRVHTAREGVYKRAVEERSNVPDAIGTASFHCSPAASVGPNGELTVGAVTATASFRFAKWIDGWLEHVRLQRHHRQGRHVERDLRESFVPHRRDLPDDGRLRHRVRCSGAASRRSLLRTGWRRSVSRRRSGCWMSSASGRSWSRAISRATRCSSARTRRSRRAREALYKGTRPATLRRFGETDDKTDEVI